MKWRKIPLLLLLICLGFNLMAQKNNDFIISLTGDTIFGKVILKSHAHHIKFKTKGSKATFFPETVLTFGVYNKAKNKYHIFKPIRTYAKKPVFLKVLEEGNLKLYQETKYDASRQLDVTIHTCFYLGRTKESLQLLVPRYYEEVVGYFFKEHPDLVAQLKAATFFDIPRLVHQYNKNSTKIIFQNTKS